MVKTYQNDGKMFIFAKFYLGGPSRLIRQKNSSGYTAKSGVIKPWLKSFIELVDEQGSQVSPLIDHPHVKVMGVALENDGTALKPSIQFDDSLNINVGLKDQIDIGYVRSNPSPKPEYLRDNVVTEANVSYISTVDNNVSLPVSVTYKPNAVSVSKMAISAYEWQSSSLQLTVSLVTRKRLSCPFHLTIV